MKVAFDNVAFQVSLGQRPRAMRACTIGDKEFATDIVNREDQIVLLYFQYTPDGYIVGMTQPDSSRRG